jgi:thiamine-phosphate pyrophosphorylase
MIGEAAAAGVDLVQVREPDLPARVLAEFVRDVLAITRSHGTRVVVNERADVALATGAHGVHLRGDSASPARVRTLEAGWLIGRSVHPGSDLHEPGADYLLFGTVAATMSKGAGAPLAGIEGLRGAIAAARLPVLAIGGMTEELAETCVAEGAAGIAAIGAFLPAGSARRGTSIRRATLELRAALDRGVTRRTPI